MLNKKQSVSSVQKECEDLMGSGDPFHQCKLLPVAKVTEMVVRKLLDWIGSDKTMHRPFIWTCMSQSQNGAFLYRSSWWLGAVVRSVAKSNTLGGDVDDWDVMVTGGQKPHCDGARAACVMRMRAACIQHSASCLSESARRV
jgi:hypothetical protein